MTRLRPVIDEREAKRLRGLMEPMVLEEHLLSPRWLREQGWVAVPVEQKPYEDGIADMCQALRALNINRCVVAVNESLTSTQGFEAAGIPLAYELEVSEKAFWEVNAMPELCHFVIFPEDRSFAVLQGRLCYIVAGPWSFVETAVGGSIERAWDEIDAVCQVELDAGQVEGQILRRVIREFRP